MGRPGPILFLNMFNLKIQGTIKRRLLVNFRVRPHAVRGWLPAPFRPKLHQGYAIAGICLIRLDDIRPAGWPATLGLSSENAAHRIAVEWSEAGTTREGVYIWRRDTGSLVNRVAGGRWFPGEPRLARFDVAGNGPAIAWRVRSADGRTRVDVAGQDAAHLPAGSVFRSLPVVSDFFAAGSVGFSPTRAGRLDGLKLRTKQWSVAPFAIDHARSSYFEDPAMFAPGSVEFDCALVMRNVTHEWEAVSDDVPGGDHRNPRAA